MKEYPHCKSCKAMCYSEHMVNGECVPCTRKTVKALKQEIKELKKKLAIPARPLRIGPAMTNQPDFVGHGIRDPKPPDQ